MSPPTPETMSIIVLDSVSSRICSSTWKSPDSSQVYAVDTTSRSPCPSAQRPMNATSAPPKATNVVSVEIHAAALREMRVPAIAIASAPTSGERRQTPGARDHRLSPGARLPGRRRGACAVWPLRR